MLEIPDRIYLSEEFGVGRDTAATRREAFANPATGTHRDGRLDGDHRAGTQNTAKPRRRRLDGTLVGAPVLAGGCPHANEDDITILQETGICREGEHAARLSLLQQLLEHGFVSHRYGAARSSTRFASLSRQTG